MTVDHLHRFLTEVQGDDKVTKEDAQGIINSSSILHRRGLHLDAFFKYLLSDANLPLSPVGVKSFIFLSVF